MSKRVGKLAKRYARALLKSFQGDVPAARKLGEDLELFAAQFFANRELKLSILSPMFNRDERLAALLKLGQEGGLSATGVQFLRLLFERDRLVNLEEIAVAFVALADEAAAIVEVEVTTARPVSVDEVREIEEAVSRSLKGTGVFHWQVDGGLLGGMVIKHSGTVMDGSLRGRIERLEQALIEGRTDIAL